MTKKTIKGFTNVIVGTSLGGAALTHTADTFAAYPNLRGIGNATQAMIGIGMLKNTEKSLNLFKKK